MDPGLPHSAADRPILDIGEEFAILRATPPDLVEAHVALAYDGAPLPAVLCSDPGALLARIIDALEGYWACCLAVWWPRIRAVLEADVVYRARRLALDGAQGLFADLDPRVTWTRGRLMVDHPFPVLPQPIDVAGRGLVLAPTLFVRGAVTFIGGDEPPLISYPARGRATVWEQSPSPAPGVLADLLGATRAWLLSMLESPATTTELAHRLDVTPGAVSRHLTALHRARLLNRARSGRSVLYVRSPLGDALHGPKG